ncbi:MAG: sugar phosphate isomerase/epimerase family protein [Methanocella sp.]
MTKPRIGACLMLQFAGGYREYVEFAIEQGFDWVEFKYDPPYLMEDHLARLRPDAVRELGERHGVGFSLHAPYYEVNIGSLNPGLRAAGVAEVIRAVDLAERLGCRSITIHGGDLSGEDVSREFVPTVVEHTLESLRTIQQACARRGMILCLENRNAAQSSRLKVGVQPNEVVEMCEAVGAEIGVTLDLGHANVSGIDPLEFIDRVGADRIKLVHAHDNGGHHDDHLAVGRGTIDYREFARRYLTRGWDFPLAVECKQVEAVVESVRELRRLFAAAEKE